MRLIVHAGLHQTGATYLQHVLSENREALRARGIFYPQEAGSCAHHRIAADLLRRDPVSLLAAISAAKAAGCHEMILSSQLLEGAILDRALAAGLELAAQGCGVALVEWHICLRDPGDSFAALYARLQQQLYTDPAAMAVEIMREGVKLVLEPSPYPDAAPFQAFCFDHFRIISAFAARTSNPVCLHDFRDSAPFPGWRMLDRLGLLDALRVLPGAEARNPRPGESEVQAGYAHQILRRLPDGAHRRRLRPMIDDQVRRNAAMVEDYARAIRDLFAPGTAAALQIFACPGVEGQEPLRACA